MITTYEYVQVQRLLPADSVLWETLRPHQHLRQVFLLELRHREEPGSSGLLLEYFSAFTP